MRAAPIYEHGSLEEIILEENCPDPTPNDDGVVIEAKTTSINYHDILTRRGMPGIRIDFSIVTGSDIAGEIIELGSAITGWSLGNRIFLDPTYSDSSQIRLKGEIGHREKTQRVWLCRRS